MRFQSVFPVPKKGEFAKQQLDIEVLCARVEGLWCLLQAFGGGPPEEVVIFVQELDNTTLSAAEGGTCCDPKVG